MEVFNNDYRHLVNHLKLMNERMVLVNPKFANDDDLQDQNTGDEQVEDDIQDVQMREVVKVVNEIVEQPIDEQAETPEIPDTVGKIETYKMPADAENVESTRKSVISEKPESTRKAVVEKQVDSPKNPLVGKKVESPKIPVVAEKVKESAPIVVKNFKESLIGDNKVPTELRNVDQLQSDKSSSFTERKLSVGEVIDAGIEAALEHEASL